MTPIHDTLLEEEMRSSYIDYAMSVIVSRALPDVKDGLKPVQRRILFAMKEVGLFPNKPFRKSATVVGEVIGKFHPHGDKAVYDALVRMAQNFSLRYPLVQGQGNFGSIDGDPPAAYRYTEARLAHSAMALLADIDEETVDFVPNFDGRLQEPAVLPSKFPGLLVNGSSGIAVGMATNIPPHNLNEVVDGLIFLIDKPEADVSELLEIVKGPDFPTGAEIMGRSGIREAYTTGRGKIVVRAKTHFEEDKKRVKIVVTEIPYQVNKSSVIEKIARLAKDKRIEGIQDLRDESDRRGIRVVIEIKKGYDPELILNKLYIHTSLQVTFGTIMLALVNGVPRVLNLKEVMSLYIAHREDVLTKRTKFRLRKASQRAHILEGFKIALDHIDEIIQLIKESHDQNEARTKLMKSFGLSEAQAKAILDMKLGNLTRLDRNRIESEYETLIKEIARLRSILESRELLRSLMKEELLDVKKQFGDNRRTTIIDAEPGSFNIEDLIPREEVVITLTYRGYVKRTSEKMYKSQGRGGTGKNGIVTYEDDFPIGVFKCNSHDNILLVSNLGRAFSLKAYDLPEASLRTKGRPIKGFIRLQKDELIRFIIPVPDFEEEKYVSVISKKGYLKKTLLNHYRYAGKSGIIALRMREDDKIVDVTLTDGNEQIVVAKDSGYGIRFDESEIRPMSRYARGVRGIKVKQEESVVSMSVVKPGKKLILVTENGYGKKIEPQKIRQTHRGSQGVKLIKLSKNTGKLISVAITGSGDYLILLTRNGSVIKLKSDDVSKLGRYARGVKLMKIRRNDKIVDMEIIEKSSVEEEEMF